MTPEEIKAIAVAVATETAREMQRSVQQGCSFCTDEGRERHTADHAFINDLNGFLDRLNGIRWGVAKALVQTLVIAGVMGLIAFMWRHGINK